MNASRRGFFAFGAGAAVAGPAAVKSALADVSSGTALKYAHAGANSATPSWHGDTAQCQPVTEKEWLKGRLERLVKDRQERESQPIVADRGHSRAHSIDGLRSVSVQNRARMIAEEAVRRERELSLSWIDKEIAEIKKGLGLLGMVL